MVFLLFLFVYKYVLLVHFTSYTHNIHNLSHALDPSDSKWALIHRIPPNHRKKMKQIAKSSTKAFAGRPGIRAFDEEARYFSFGPVPVQGQPYGKGHQAEVNPHVVMVKFAQGSRVKL